MYLRPDETGHLRRRRRRSKGRGGQAIDRSRATAVLLLRPGEPGRSAAVSGREPLGPDIHRDRGGFQRRLPPGAILAMEGYRPGIQGPGREDDKY